MGVRVWSLLKENERYFARKWKFRMWKEKGRKIVEKLLCRWETGNKVNEEVKPGEGRESERLEIVT